MIVCARLLQACFHLPAWRSVSKITPAIFTGDLSAAAWRGAARRGAARRGSNTRLNFCMKFPEVARKTKKHQACVSSRLVEVNKLAVVWQTAVLAGF